MSETEQVNFEGSQVAGQQSGGEVQGANVQQTQPGQPEPAKEHTTGLTEDQVLELIAKSNQQTLTEAQRYAQSLVDKADNRFQKRIGQIQDRARELGLGSDDPAVQASINEVKRQALIEEFNSQGQQARQPVQEDEPADPLAAYAQQRQQALAQEFGGIDLKWSDPEAAGVKGDSLEDYLSTYRAALQKKAERLKAQPAQPQAQPHTPQPAIRMPGLGQGAPTKQDWQQQLAKETAGKSSRQVIEIRKKYRDQGYPI